MQEQTFQAGPLTLNYARGPGAGTPLVFLHGAARVWQDFQPIFPDILPRWPVFALDHRGHGRSQRSDSGSYHVIDYVPDALAFLETVVGEPAVLIGHSLGGMIAAAVAAQAPERVRAVVLEDPPFEMMGPRIDETLFPSLFKAYRAVAGVDRPVDEVARDLGQAPISRPGQVDPSRLCEVRDPAAIRLSAVCLRRLDPAVLAPIVAGRWLDGFDVAATLSRVSCPALFLQADFSTGGALPDDYAEHLASLLPRGTLVRLPGAGHMIHWSRAEEMARVVAGFLEEVGNQ